MGSWVIRYALSWAVLVIFSWGYFYRFSDFGSLGSGIFNALGDELLGLWIFERFSGNLFGGGQALFDGGVFYPAQKSLAFVESMPLLGILYRSFSLVVGHRVLSYHLTVLTLFGLNFLSMYWFCRKFLFSSAALLASLVFSYSMIRSAQFSHIQLLPQFFFPLVAGFIYKFENEKKATYLRLACLLIIGQFYCSIYLGMILFLNVAMYVVLRIWRLPEKKEYLVELSRISLILLLGLLPLAYPYFLVGSQHKVVRNLSHARPMGANLTSYFSAPPGNVYEPFTKHLLIGENFHEKHLFIGFVVLGLILIGIFRLRKKIQPLRNFWCAVVLGCLFFSIWMSLGPNGGLFSVLYYLFPGLTVVRVPARFGLAYLFWMALIAGICWQLLVKQRPAFVNTTLAILFALIFLMENSLRITLVRIPDALVGVSQFLSKTIDKKPVAHFPISAPYPRYPGDVGNRYNNRETVRMFYSLLHDHPIINGYGGFQPTTFRKIRDIEVAKGPGDALLAALRSLGVGYLVVEKEFAEVEDENRWQLFLKQLDIVHEDRHTVLAKLKN